MAAAHKADIVWACSSGMYDLPDDMKMPSLRELRLQQCAALEILTEKSLSSLTSLTLLDLSR